MPRESRRRSSGGVTVLGIRRRIHSLLPLVQDGSDLLNGLTEILRDIVSGRHADPLDDIVTLFIDIIIASQRFTGRGYRHLVMQLIVYLKRLPMDEGIDSLEIVVDRLERYDRVYKEHLQICCEYMTVVYEAEENYRRAAYILGVLMRNVNLRRIYSVRNQFLNFIKIARLFLQCDDVMLAEEMIKEAERLLPNCTNPVFQIIYKLVQTRMFACDQKFMIAAQQYHAIATQSITLTFDEIEPLRDSIFCAILAPVGPDKYKLLADLYKEERARNITGFHIIEKMHLGQIIFPRELDALEDVLQMHQLQRAPDNLDWMLHDRAITEHNILAMGKLFDNIKFVDLAEHLGITTGQAFVTAREMVEEGRLAALINQSNMFLHFNILTDDGITDSQVRYWFDHLYPIMQLLNHYEPNWMANLGLNGND